MTAAMSTCSFSISTISRYTLTIYKRTVRNTTGQVSEQLHNWVGVLKKKEKICVSGLRFHSSTKWGKCFREQGNHMCVRGSTAPLIFDCGAVEPDYCTSSVQPWTRGATTTKSGHVLCSFASKVALCCVVKPDSCGRLTLRN